MTTMKPRFFKCAVCGAEEMFYMLTSTNQFGSPDLDLRPAEMARSTMDQWVQECPSCGYVARYIMVDPGKVTREYLQSPEYAGCDGLQFKSDLAARFYRLSRVSLINGKTPDAYNALVHAAWACDDEQDENNAVHCRKAAIELADEIIDSMAAGNEKQDKLLQKADLLRRSGQFERLIREYSEQQVQEEFYRPLFAFELDAARRKDTACHTIDEAKKAFGSAAQKD